MPSGRIVVTGAVVLARRDHREYDRVCLLYTEEFGKVPVRFIGVNRPRGKLKALSEPMVWGEYRLHLRAGSEHGTALGGGIRSVFPGVRADLECTLRGLEACELADRLTPTWQASAEKYGLLTGCLRTLERAALSRASGGPPLSPSWTLAAFGLRMLEAAGVGASTLRVSEPNRALWDALHAADLDSAAALPEDRGRQARLDEYLLRSVERFCDRPFRSPRLRGVLNPAVRPEAVPA